MTLRPCKPMLAAIFAACACACAGQAWAGPVWADDTYVAPVEEALEQAQRQYARGRYGEAFGNFFWAAMREDARAQEIVGLMYLLGQKVYGQAVRADGAQARFWLAEAASLGRPSARTTQCALAQANKGARAPELVMACVGN
jgi:TPR repeat protein